MRALGPCDGDREEPCVRIRCTFENQGPLPTRGDVLLDVWTERDRGDASDPAVYASETPYGEKPTARRRREHLRLGARERIEVVRDVPGVRWVRGATMVRCMPWYAGGFMERVEEVDRPAD